MDGATCIDQQRNHSSLDFRLQNAATAERTKDGALIFSRYIPSAKIASPRSLPARRRVPKRIISMEITRTSPKRTAAASASRTIREGRRPPDAHLATCRARLRRARDRGQKSSGFCVAYSRGNRARVAEGFGRGTAE